MAKGRFNIKGTKDFLVAAVACAFLCLWAIHDAWFPSKKVSEKHPQEVLIAMKVSGVIKSLPRTPGEEIKGEVVLAEIYDASYRKAVKEAEAGLKAAKNTGESVIRGRSDTLLSARADLNACRLTNKSVILSFSHGEEVHSGTILEYRVEPGSSVEVVKAKSPGRVLKVAGGGVFVSSPDSTEFSDAVEYQMGEDMAPVVRVDDEVLEGTALAGTTVLVMEPHDTFYAFNKTLAIFSLIGFFVSLVFHRIASR